MTEVPEYCLNHFLGACFDFRTCCAFRSYDSRSYIYLPLSFYASGASLHGAFILQCTATVLIKSVFRDAGKRKGAVLQELMGCGGERWADRIHLQRAAAPPHAADWETQVVCRTISAYLLISGWNSGAICGAASRRGGGRSCWGSLCHVGAEEGDMDWVRPWQ